MRNVIKFTICVVIVVAGWVAYWGNRPPNGDEMQIYGLLIGLVAIVGRAFLWAIMQITSYED